MAAKSKLAGVKIQTPEFRANWVFIHRPRASQEEGKKPQYSVTCLFKKGEDLTKIKQTILKAGAEMWGADTSKWPKNLYTPFKNQGEAFREREDGTEYLPDGYEPGAMFMEAKTYNLPGCVDQKCVPITDETEFYSGCYARAIVVFKAYDFKGKKGITCYLQHVQKTKDGENLAGRTKAENEFEAIALDEDQTFDTETNEVDDILGI